MAGYALLLRIRRLEEQCAQMGFRMAHSKHGYAREFGDVVALYPAEDALPVYSRDAELFVGTFDDLERWLQGVEWAQRYYKMLRLVDDKKVARKEQDERNRRLVAVLTGESSKEKD